MSDSKRRKNRPEKIAPGSCMLCRTTEDDEFFFGKFYEVKFQGSLIRVHYYCILFACGLAQNGRSSREGIEGFLVKDIIAESNRGARLRCSYCGLTGATVGCSLKKCKKVFHLHCGRRNGSLSEFFGQFCTYCADHKRRQKVLNVEDEQDVLCSICCSAIEVEDPDSFLKAPCCASNLFHRKCIQLYALSAGYFFKCPLCNDKSSFEREMLNHGIHIPKQDASWEKERNAFQELLIRAKCDAFQCICPKGRQENQEKSMWRLVYCEDCGSTGRHVGCEKLSLTKKRTWKCADCAVFDKKFSKTRKKKKPYQIYTDCEAGTSSNARCIRISANAKKLLQRCKSCSVHLKHLRANDLPRIVNTAKKYKHVLKKIRMQSSCSSASQRKHKRRTELKETGEKHRYNKKTKSQPKIESNEYSKGMISPKENNENKISKPTCSSFIIKNATQTLINQFMQSNQSGRLHHQKIKQTLIDSFLKNNMAEKNHTKPIFMKNEEKYVSVRVKSKRSVKCHLKQMNKITEFTSTQNFVNHNVTVKKSLSQTVNFYFDTKPNVLDPMPEFSKYDDDDDDGGDDFNMSFVKNENYSSDFRRLVQELKSVTPATPENFLECKTKMHLAKDSITSQISALKRKTINEFSDCNEISKKKFRTNDESIVKMPGNTSECIFSKVGQSKQHCHSAGASHEGYTYIKSEYVNNVHVADSQFFTRGTPATLSVILENYPLQSDRTISPEFPHENYDAGSLCRKQVLDVVPLNNLMSDKSESKQLKVPGITLENSEEISSILKSAENIMNTKMNLDLLYHDIPSTFRKHTLNIDRLFNVSAKPTALMANSTFEMQPVALQKSDSSLQLDSRYISFPSLMKLESRAMKSGNENNITSPMQSASTFISEKRYIDSEISSAVQKIDYFEIRAVGKQLGKCNMLKVKELLSCGCLSGAHPDNACIKKLAFPTCSSAKPSPDNEKKKKRSKYSTEKADKKTQQTNTLLSYFYGL